jgi:hypothetical protein
MEELKLLLLEKGDSQKNLVDKVNYNFSQIISFEGGPYGKVGPEGREGNPGSSGPKGSFGPQGKRGNEWTVSNSSPSNPIDGDYWVNPSLENETRIYNFSNSSWDLYSVSINGLGLFKEFGPLQTDSGPSSKNGYFISLPFPLDNTLVLSDSLLSNGSPIANPRYSKLMISTDSGNLDRKILGFSKSPYQGTSFDSLAPSFFWSPGPTSSQGNYSLTFLSPQNLEFNLGGDFSMRSISGSILIKSGDSWPYRINSYLTGTYGLNTSFGRLSMNISSGSGHLLFQGKNINFPDPSSQTIFTTTGLDIRTTGTTGSQPSLNVISNDYDTGNIYYKMDEVYPSTRSGSTLFKATNSTTNILEISGKGDFKVNKIVYPLHPLENPSIFVSTGLGTVADPYISWEIFTPTVSLNGNTDAGSFNVSRGSDFYIETPYSNPPSPFNLEWGICLWTKGSGNDGGWLNLLNDSEYINFRIHSSDPSVPGFRFISINTTNNKNSAPSLNGNDRIDFGKTNRAQTVEFTIINISKTATGITSGNRWFKVLYQAYGGDLSTPVCGELYTNGSTP